MSHNNDAKQRRLGNTHETDSNTHSNDDDAEKNVQNVTEQRPTGSKFNKYNLFFLSSTISIIMIIALKFYYSFGVVNELYYKTVFYGWRTLYGDKNMYSTTWRYIKPNKYDRDNDADSYTKLVKMAQDDEILFTGHPEHYPRGQNGYSTHSDSKFNRKFLKYRTKFCNAFDEPLTEEQINGTDQIGDKDMKYWTEKKDVNVKDIYNEAPIMIKEFMVLLTIFLNNLDSGYYKGSGLVGKDCPDIIAKDIQKIAYAADLDVKLEYINTVPAKFGRARANVYELFAYSRIFYLVYLHTLNAKIDIFNGLEDSLDGATGKEKLKIEQKIADIRKSKNSRMKTVSSSLAELFSNIYKYDFGTYETQGGFLCKQLRSIFGNKKAKFVSQEKNISILLEELNKIVEPDRVISS